MTGRREQLLFAGSLRATGAAPPAIARQLRDRFAVRALAAMRLAHGWSQSEAAAEWTRRWPDAPRTFKNFSYWENWPGPSGHAPSVDVLERLSRLYACGVHDLLADLPDHGAGDGDPADAETLAWQVRNLDLPELTRAVTRWADRVEHQERRAWLLKLSTAAAAGASVIGSDSGRPGLTVVRAAPDESDRLTGIWLSRYTYVSTSRGPIERRHHMTVDEDRNGGVTVMSTDGSNDSPAQLDLFRERQALTGTWTEYTAPDGHYRGARYHGAIKLVLDPTGRAASGRWVGFDRAGEVDSGPWHLSLLTTRTGPATVREYASPAAPESVGDASRKGPSPGER
ncbi:hypothetical protein [Pseudonocardia sp. HH130630-07]|uniref:hypothetical protein n=1 Tax=Pseudonocardia sp. HH130630-07 TaxID=1690815 RepID=UPI00081503E6|nr:hypothetical protein [Pseudonocardia sp. HH130630-07]ANY06687.1 hypothetical protein AFB00_10710 [Pseudonocardia sp. HH130630-07]